jgi:hypothetical protein
MTLIERATKSANSVAEQTVSTVSQIGTAIAEGVVVTAEDVRAGMKDGHIRPRTVLAAAAIGLVAVVEWPVLIVAGGAAMVAGKLKSRSTEPSDDDASTTAAENGASATAENGASATAENDASDTP